MKRLLALAVVALLAVSCSHDDAPVNEGGGADKLYPVSFSTNFKFTTDDTPFSLARMDSLYNPGDSGYYPQDSLFYNYIVYSNTGAFLKQKWGTGTKINDELTAGQYKIAIIGSTSQNLLDYNLQPQNFYWDSISHPQAFYNAFDYYIDEYSGIYDSCKNVVLERMWGEIYLEVQDRVTCHIPAGVHSIAISVGGASEAFSTESKNGSLSIHRGNYIDGMSVAQFRNALAPIKCLTSYSTPNGEVEVKLILFSGLTDAKTVILGTAKVKRGVKTTLRGNLGNSLQTNVDPNLTIFLDENWSNETITF